MLFIIRCFDKENSLEVRKANRAVHLKYNKTAGERLKFAGPIMASEEDQTPVGSLIILDAASTTAAELYAENDPYAKAGLFEKVIIKPTVAVMGDWVSKQE